MKQSDVYSVEHNLLYIVEYFAYNYYKNPM